MFLSSDVYLKGSSVILLLPIFAIDRKTMNFIKLRIIVDYNNPLPIKTSYWRTAPRIIELTIPGFVKLLTIFLSVKCTNIDTITFCQSYRLIEAPINLKRSKAIIVTRTPD